MKEAEFVLAGEFLLEFKKEFGERDEESAKVMELKRLKQKGRTIEEFVQELQRIARGSGYEERTLIEEFKKRMNRAIRRKLIGAERLLTGIEQ